LKDSLHFRGGGESNFDRFGEARSSVTGGEEELAGPLESECDPFIAYLLPGALAWEFSIRISLMHALAGRKNLRPTTRVAARQVVDLGPLGVAAAGPPRAGPLGRSSA